MVYNSNLLHKIGQWSSTLEWICVSLTKLKITHAGGAKNDKKIRKHLEKEKVAELKKKEKQECPTENKVEKKQEMRLKSHNVQQVFARKRASFVTPLAKVEWALIVHS